MAQNLDLNININTKGSEVIGVIRKQLKEANGELLKAQTLYGDYSKEAVLAAKKVAELKDKISEARETSDLFDPGKKFQAFTGVLSAAAGGLAAVQGAMGLLGSESENVQKTLLKVQSALALSQGLSTIKDSAKDFARLGTIIKSTTVFQAGYNFVMGQSSEVLKAANVEITANIVDLNAQSTATIAVATTTSAASIAMRIFRAALIATGIGAIVVLVTALVEGFTNLTSSTKKAKDEQDKINESFKVQAEILDKNVLTITRSGQLRISELKKNGATEAELVATQREIDLILLNEYEQNYRKIYLKYQDDKKKNGKSTDKEILAGSEEIRKAAINAEKQYRDQEIKLEVNSNEELARIRKENQDRKEKEEKEAQDKLQKDLLQSYEDYLKRREFARKNSEGLYKEEIRKFDQEDTEERDKKRNQEIDKNIIAQNKALDSIKQNGVEILEIDKANAEARIRINELEKESKLATAYAIADIVAGLSSIIGQESKEGKAIAIASATIDTYLSASTLFKQAAKSPTTILNPAYPYLVAAPAVLAGIARVKQIIAVPLPKGGSGGSVPPALSTAAPMLPQLPAAQMTQLNAQSINDLGNQAVRAYVIETDVTGNQQRMAAIRQRARFS